ncbi:hypothetical protein SEEH1023_00410 [Salmonella enterica subsp. enterica serovar Heidelberg str. 670102-3]|nr:hypothetical protein SEEN554_04325 [Salmonella enterica subsp. enterica serovar Newport str. CVM 21554]ALC64623.1 hypothetical protein ABT64_19020 [Salmonella enterica subsp. enterica serovar Newport]ELO82923.1 hypothetical protein SEEERB17_000440 [Salmonella enterica subsp. enterica serovar Enteritidis str. SARB17]ESB61852.1 hypothetical protein SEER0660_22388 [Salmonella enterica subsp. enterica serovar Muenster str. 660]ESE44382.1 hypothetical protein SEEH4390_18059 [Salmonella enterica s
MGISLGFCEVCFWNKSNSDLCSASLASAYLAIAAQTLRPIAHDDHAVVITAFGVFRDAAAIILHF